MSQKGSMSLGDLKAGIAILRGKWDRRTASQAYLVLMRGAAADNFVTREGHTLLTVVPRDDEIACLTVDLFEQAFPDLKGRFIYRAVGAECSPDPALF